MSEDDVELDSPPFTPAALIEFKARGFERWNRWRRAILDALPVNEEHERLMDALIAKRTASLKTRPLRRRAEDPGRPTGTKI
jgi:hypothetical protein